MKPREDKIWEILDQLPTESLQQFAKALANMARETRLEVHDGKVRGPERTE